MSDLKEPLPLNECKTTLDFAYRNRYKCLKHNNAFFATFGIPLKKFWESNILGFDMLAFDKWLGCGDKSLQEVLTERYGKDACDLVKDLI
jgi:hypothetical protein|tara:strand:+ start:34873 stop:35142 length:270 start_codon:yes stop_codon:yes gene_type:complete